VIWKYSTINHPQPITAQLRPDEHNSQPINKLDQKRATPHFKFPLSVVSKNPCLRRAILNNKSLEFKIKFTGRQEFRSFAAGI
jgi:hypothetical protein